MIKELILSKDFTNTILALTLMQNLSDDEFREILMDTYKTAKNNIIPPYGNNIQYNKLVRGIKNNNAFILVIKDEFQNEINLTLDKKYILLLKYIPPQNNEEFAQLNAFHFLFETFTYQNIKDTFYT